MRKPVCMSAPQQAHQFVVTVRRRGRIGGLRGGRERRVLRREMLAIEPVWKWVLRATGLLLTYNPAMLQSEIIFSIQESPEGGHEARARLFDIHSSSFA
jgi:hypothetical protein